MSLSVCVKCKKPVEHTQSIEVVRCPHCKDFFKPLSQKIVLIEEELLSLNLKRPGAFFFKNPSSKKILFVLLLFGIFSTPGAWKLICFALLFSLILFHFFMLSNQKAKKIQELEKELHHLNRIYAQNAHSSLSNCNESVSLIATENISCSTSCGGGLK